MALLDALHSDANVGVGDPTSVPLVAAASQGSPLPRNFLVRKVMEEAAGGSALGGMQIDADMDVLGDVSHAPSFAAFLFAFLAAPASPRETLSL